jgi:hypothetical protein
MAAEENLSSTVIYGEFDNALPNYRLAGVRFDPWPDRRRSLSLRGF